MYRWLYWSFVNGYSKTDRDGFGRTSATWFLAALAFANTITSVSWLAQNRVPGFAEAFRVVKNPAVAVSLALVWLYLHYVLTAPYRLAPEREPRDANAPKWPGRLYTIVTVIFCLYVSKSMD